MRKLHCLLFLVITAFLQPALYGAEPNPVLKHNSLAALHIDGKAVSDMLSGQISELMKPENKGRLAGMTGSDIEGISGGRIDYEKLLSDIDSFLKSGVFTMTGSAWFAFDEDFRPSFHIISKNEPEKLVEFMQRCSYAVKQLNFTLASGSAVTEIKTAENVYTFSIASNAVQLLNNAPVQPYSEKVWEGLISASQNKNLLAAAKVDAAGLYELSLRDGQITATDSVGIHMKAMNSLEIELTRSELTFKAEYNDQAVQNDTSAVAAHYLQTMRYANDKQRGRVPEKDRLRILHMINSISVTSEGNWLNLQIKNLDEQIIVSVIAALIGAADMAVESEEEYSARLIQEAAAEKAASEQQAGADAAKDPDTEQCKKMQAGIHEALKEYMLKEENMPELITIEELQSKGYLKTLPICPEGGKYELTRQEDIYNVNCTKHK